MKGVWWTHFVLLQPGTVSAMDYGLDRRVDPNADEVTGESLRDLQGLISDKKL